MFVVDRATKRITLHRGDTGNVTFDFSGETLDPDYDRVLFTISTASKEIIRQEVLIPSENTVVVSFKNDDTDKLIPGVYYYDVRVIIRPVYDSADPPHIVEADYDNGGAVRTPGSPFELVILDTVGQI